MKFTIILKYVLNLVIVSMLSSLFFIGLFLFFKPNVDNMMAFYMSYSGSALPTASASTPQATSPDTVEKVANHAINATKDAIDVFKWAIIAIIGIFGSVIGYFVKTLNDTDKKLNETGNKVREVQIELESTSRKFEDTQKTLGNLTYNYFELQQELFDLPSTILPYDLAVDAFETGKIDRQAVIESQQWFSWLKMVYSKEARGEIGYQELIAYDKESGIPLKIKRAMLTELDKIDLCLKRRGFLKKEEISLKTRILNLLGIQETMSKK